MSRTWLIARHHFQIQAQQKSFWILLFSLPLFLGLTVGLGILMESLFNGNTTLGYVDPAGFLTVSDLDDEEVTVLAFETPETAQAALDNEEIAGYFVFTADYPENPAVDLIYYDFPPYGAQAAFLDMVRRNHLVGESPEVTARAMTRAEVLVHNLDNGRVYGDDPTAADFLPLFVALMFGFLAMTTSGYMMEVLVAEKENRTMEIVISSVSSNKLMTGKILGAVAIAAMQLVVWLLCLVLALFIGRIAGVSWLMEVHPRWQDIFQMVIVAIPVYFFLTALFTTIGATLTESNDAQQIGPFIFLVLLIPIYFMPLLVENPHNALALALSFFPPTAITMYALRMLITTIPWWQIIVSAAISTIFAVLMTWLAAKSFRLGMLRYGQRLRLKDLFQRETAPAESRPAFSGD